MAYNGRNEEAAPVDNMSTDDKINMILQMVKELNGNVNETGNNVNQLSNTVNQLSNTVGQLSNTVDQLSNTVDQLSSDVKEIKEDQKQMNERLGKVEIGLKVFIKETNENKIETERIKHHVGLEF